jgi:hypothetical protein
MEFPKKNWLDLQLDDIIKIFGLTLWSIPKMSLIFLERPNEISDAQRFQKIIKYILEIVNSKATLFSLPNNYKKLTIEILLDQ